MSKSAKTQHGEHDSHQNQQDQSGKVLCSQPPPIPLIIPDGLTPEREYAIRISDNRWVNGTVLHYYFLKRMASPSWSWPEDQKKIVQWAFGVWKSLGIGLAFVEVSDISEAEIRIGREQNNRSWSYVGTDTLKYKDLDRTMNFGWDLTTEWGKATALHEIGHTIGMSHEHQNPKSGIIWNEQNVYDYFSGDPNYWDHDTIYNNIIRKLDVSMIEGSKWNVSSIMEYPFRPGLIRSPKPYDVKGIGENTKLSSEDKSWVEHWYPSTSAPVQIAAMQFEKLNAAAGQQRDYLFKPSATREYKIQTIGESDSRVVIFEERNGEPRYCVSGDDSGLDQNNKINVKMIKDRNYIIRVRVNYINSPDGVGIIIS